MVARWGLNRRYLLMGFVIAFLFLIGLVYRKPEVRKMVSMGVMNALPDSIVGLPASTSSNAAGPIPGDSLHQEYRQKDAIENNSDALRAKMEKGEIKQDDPDLIQYIKTMIFLPSLESYNIKTTEKDTSMGQAKIVDTVLKGMKNGFFIECGALDGETRSNTYYFERYLDWQGMLIEGDPSNFKLLLDKHRKAYSVNICLSTTDKPMKVIFKQSFNIGKIVKYQGSKLDSGYVPVQCFPLYSILLAMNRTTVDYFSLDVEGAELDILKTIPFDKVNIRVLSVEYIHDEDGESGVRSFMESKGYIAHQKVNNPNNLANDIIFVKPGILDA